MGLRVRRVHFQIYFICVIFLSSVDISSFAFATNKCGWVFNLHKLIQGWKVRIEKRVLSSNQSITIAFAHQILIPKHDRYYNSYSIYLNGKLLNELIIKTMDPKTFIELIYEASRQIESHPDIKAFLGGKLNTDRVENAQVLGWQYLIIWDRLTELVESMKVEEIRKLLNYIFNKSMSLRPFSYIVTSAVQRAYSFNRDNLLQVWQEEKMLLSEALSFIDMQSVSPPVLLAQPITISSLKRDFIQGIEQNEKNIVLTNRNFAFLVNGMNPREGIITYRDFNDLVLDIHTHPVDWAFSTGDIEVYKRLEQDRRVYSVQGNVNFFVRSPSGIFAFVPVNSKWESNRMDQKKDVYFMPVVVRYVTSQGQIVEHNFSGYTNNDKCQCGQFMIHALKAGALELTVTFQNGDSIQYCSWSIFEQENFMENNIRDLPRIFSILKNRKEKIHP